MSDEMSWLEQRKFYSAQRIYRNREMDTEVPSGECTWRAWFEAKYGESLEDYAVRAKAEALRQKLDRTIREIAP